ncbi:MAG: hypothetical protein RL695_2570, partial [Pseudomonadota bacterium]
ESGRHNFQLLIFGRLIGSRNATVSKNAWHGAHFAERDRLFRQSVTDAEMLHG